MRIAFLLGSGISVAAGMPLVDEISGRVQSGAGVIRHTDELYYLDQPGYPDSRDAERARPAIEFTQELWPLADAYFTEYLDGRKADYEDIASLAGTISDAISGEYENPGLRPLLADLHAPGRSIEAIQKLAAESRSYIHDVVWGLLHRDPGRVEHLRSVTDACRSFEQVDFFDLTHDRVFEGALRDAEIDCSDGFARHDGDVSIWSDEFATPVRHFKLHGSIGWFSRRIPGETWRGQVAMRTESDDPHHDRGACGELLEYPAGGRPLLLVGTFDKALAYSSFIFASQHFHFHVALRELDYLVVIGYGFRDKAINTRLIDWMADDRGHRLVIVNPCPEALRRRGRPAITRAWGEWQGAGRVSVINRGVEAVSWEDVDAALSGALPPGSE